ncbi:nitrate- and nitrite sensing domain-containing protein [Nonomuraea sp. NPDC046802]|uniref:sensor histidine kinase n=1 Tax=Nonomuraea sp. NPDC046802 TaxID=3154919 RepID=UPI0033F49F45
MVGGAQITSSISTHTQYRQVLQKADFSASISDLTHHLERERDQAVYYVAGRRAPQRETALRQQFAAVDTAMTKVKESAASITVKHGDSTWNITQQILGRLNEIQITRDTVLKSQLSTLPTLTKYSQIIATLQLIHEQISQGVEDEPLSNRVRALTALVKAKDAASQQRGLLAGVASIGFFQTGELDVLVAAHAQQESELTVFRSAATSDELQLYDDTVTGALVDDAALFRVRALAQSHDNIRINIDPDSRADPDQWVKAITGTIDGMRAVEKRLTDSITIESRSLQETESRNAVLVSVAIVTLLLMVLTTTSFVVRSLVKPLRILRTDALKIAEQRLPATVRSLRETSHEPPPAVAPIGVDSHDEIGEVARAFDEVHREAIRLAGEEARLRNNVNAMFVNLSRRSQTLVERQLELISDLEQGEQDEQRLANMFRLDHLATRMRRNSENLLVLAGQEQPRRWSEPVTLVDVARAALSEVENYERVDLKIPSYGVLVVGQVVNDVTHLLAELAENALSFSSEKSRVTISAQPGTSGTVMLEVTDTGIGMNPEELHHANERLRSVPDVDVSVSRRMGLFVVARLAQRHNIRVQLRSPEDGGLSAMVLLPEALLSLASSISTMSPQGRRPQEYASAPQLGSIGPSQSWYPPMPVLPDSWPQEAGARLAAAQTSPVGSGDASAWTPTPHPERIPSNDAPWFQPPDKDSLPSPRSTGPNQPSPPPQRPLDFPETQWEVTAPASVMAPADDEDPPIYRQAQSVWFRRADPHAARWGPAQADAGWSAAEAVKEPTRGGATAAGLPKRVPKANLVPGAAPSAVPATASRPTVSPEELRRRLSAYQQAYREARYDISQGQATGEFGDGAKTHD